MMENQVADTMADIDLSELENLEGASLVLRTSPTQEPVVGPCATRRTA